ncbi:MAG TPA: ornithine carbamoyltransferase [Atribacteraceae bacterium]|nr:ornithine carbamoyltransferase [Atribacteraceae bacterium]
MNGAFRSKDFLDLADFSAEEILYFLDTAVSLKRRYFLGETLDIHQGKTLALLFEKPSLRTRVSFEMAMKQLGGTCLYLGPQEVGLGKREAIKDVARVLSRMVDGIMVRTFAHQNVLEMAEYSDVPVFNGLSDLHHPCQILGDLLTVLEKKGKLLDLPICFIGDGNNVCNSWIIVAAVCGLQLTVCTPDGYLPNQKIRQQAEESIRKSGGMLRYEHDPREAIRGAQVVYTDVWASMGREEELARRLEIFPPYQVNEALVDLAAPDAIVMHCMPAHRGQEITDPVIDGSQSVCIDQAENRLHAQKALLNLFIP